MRRKHAALTVKTITGRRHVFHDLRPHTAATIERHVLGRPSALATVGGCAQSIRSPTSSSAATRTATRSSCSRSRTGPTSSTPCASIPGRRFDWQAKEWWAPRADATAAYVQGVIERFPELEVAPEVEEWLARAVKGWVGRVTAARRAGAGWFVLDGIAGELPEELARGRRAARRAALAAVHRGGRRARCSTWPARGWTRARCAAPPGCRSASSPRPRR